MIIKLKELEIENSRLKKMYVEERMKAEILKEVVKKSDQAISKERNGLEDSKNREDLSRVSM